MKTVRILNLAALVVMGAILAGCAKDKDVDSVAEDNIVVCTTTVTLDADDTKALSVVGDKGLKTFAKGERVALRYYNTGWSYASSQALSEEDISADGKTAILTFSLTNPQANGNIIFCYPAALAKFNNYSEFDYNQIILQNGTLASLSANLDLATASGKLSKEKQLPANVTLTNQLAILAITLKNSDGSSDITSTITGLTLSDGTNTYSISRSAAAGPIYVAIRPVSNKNITITATSGSKTYTKSLSGKTYARSNGYNVSWRMESAPTLSLTSPSVGQVIGDDGKNYAYASLPSGVTAVAVIAYVISDNNNVYHGLAIAMADENSGNNITWNPAMATAAAHAPQFCGGTWKIPSRDEWKKMFKNGSGYNQYLYNDLNTAIANAGGTPFPQGKSYWTSSDGGDNTKYIMTFNDGTYVLDGSRQGTDLATIRARSVLKF